jgi:hypothetical protein
MAAASKSTILTGSPGLSSLCVSAHFLWYQQRKEAPPTDGERERLSTPRWDISFSLLGVIAYFVLSTRFAKSPDYICTSASNRTHTGTLLLTVSSLTLALLFSLGLVTDPTTTDGINAPILGSYLRPQI